MLIGQPQIDNWGGALIQGGFGGKTWSDEFFTENLALLVGNLSKSNDWKLHLTPPHRQVAVVPFLLLCINKGNIHFLFMYMCVPCRWGLVLQTKSYRPNL